MLNSAAPYKRRKKKADNNRYPWFDGDLRNLQKIRNFYYSKARKSVTITVWDIYKAKRNLFQKKLRLKMIDYFKDKSAKF